MKAKGEVEGKGTGKDTRLGQGEIQQDKVRGVSHEFYTSHLNDKEYLFKSITYQPMQILHILTLKTQYCDCDLCKCTCVTL